MEFKLKIKIKLITLIGLSL